MLGQANSLSLGAVQQKLGHIAKNHKLYLAYYCDHFVYQAKQELIIAKKVNMVMFVFKVLIMQLVHSSMTNLAYYYHQPAPTLYDLGFATLPPLSKEDQIYSEYILLWTILALVAFAVSVFVAPLPTEERLQAFLAGSPIQPYSRVPTSTSNDADDTGEAKNTHSGSSSSNNNDNHGQTDVRISMPGGDVSSFVFRSTEYFVMLARRFGLCLCCAQVLRSLSFIVTSLPGKYTRTSTPHMHTRAAQACCWLSPLPILFFFKKKEVFSCQLCLQICTTHPSLPLACTLLSPSSTTEVHVCMYGCMDV